jgi:hypothetical protein
MDRINAIHFLQPQEAAALAGFDRPGECGKEAEWERNYRLNLPFFFHQLTSMQEKLNIMGKLPI